MTIDDDVSRGVPELLTANGPPCQPQVQSCSKVASGSDISLPYAGRMNYRFDAPQVGQEPWLQANQLPPRPRRSWMAPAALVASVAALVVGTAALVQGRGHEAPSTATITTAPATAGDTAAADKALCQAIAPLMAEDDKMSNAYIDLGPAGSPARDDALPKFRSDTEDWVRRIQAIADQHQSADPFLQRTLQRMIDDRKLLVRNMRPGKTKGYDDQIWSDSLSAYGGPLSVCYDVGVQW